jgi:hypothetical protein
MNGVDLAPQAPAMNEIDPCPPVGWSPRRGRYWGQGSLTPVTSSRFGAGPRSPPRRPGNGRHQAQPGHRARVVTFRQRQPFPRGEPGRAGPAASPDPSSGTGGRDGGGGRRDGAIWFSHLWLPLGRFPGSCHGRRPGDKGPGLPRPWSTASPEDRAWSRAGGRGLGLGLGRGRQQ